MRYFLVITALVISLVVGACSQVPSAVPTGTLTGTAPTAGPIVDAGKAIFAVRCAKCHGENGQGITGPAVIGSGSNLAKYITAQGLFDFIKLAMPMNAPGSLAKQDYLNVLSFLLVQNDFLSAASAFNPDQLQTINLKK